MKEFQKRELKKPKRVKQNKGNVEAQLRRSMEDTGGMYERYKER